MEIDILLILLHNMVEREMLSVFIWLIIIVLVHHRTQVKRNTKTHTGFLVLK